MNIFGLHTFAIAPVWDLARIEPQMDRLKEHGIGLMAVSYTHLTLPTIYSV